MVCNQFLSSPKGHFVATHFGEGTGLHVAVTTVLLENPIIGAPQQLIADGTWHEVCASPDWTTLVAPWGIYLCAMCMSCTIVLDLGFEMWMSNMDERGLGVCLEYGTWGENGPK